MATLFVSDLHLDGSRPAATDAFLNFLDHEAAAADALYILGDLFEFWIGDDDPDAEYQRVIAAIAKLTATGVRCHIMHGNRDFMLGRKFFKASGTIFLHDPTLIYVGDKSVLLSHGDVLCTDDVGYQRFRKIVRLLEKNKIVIKNTPPDDDNFIILLRCYFPNNAIIRSLTSG